MKQWQTTLTKMMWYHMKYTMLCTCLHKKYLLIGSTVHCMLNLQLDHNNTIILTEIMFFLASANWIDCFNSWGQSWYRLSYSSTVSIYAEIIQYTQKDVSSAKRVWSALCFKLNSHLYWLFIIGFLKHKKHHDSYDIYFFYQISINTHFYIQTLNESEYATWKIAEMWS